jgi:hypothetical protein
MMTRFIATSGLQHIFNSRFQSRGLPLPARLFYPPQKPWVASFHRDDTNTIDPPVHHA